VGATVGAARTSLGRLVGTYDATPEEQLFDIGFEGVLNAGGTLIAPAVKPTAGFMAKRVGEWAQFINRNAAEPTKEVLKNVMGQVVKGGSNAVELALEDGGKAVSSRLAAASRAAGNDIDQAVVSLTQDSIDHTYSIAKRIPQALGNFWDDATNKLIKEVPDNFKVSIPDALAPVRSDMIERGLATVRVRSGDSFRTLVPEEAAELLAKNNGTLPKGASVVSTKRAFGLERMREWAAKKGAVNEFFADDEVFNAVAKSVDNLEQTFGNFKDLQGKAGFKEFMKFKKVLGDQSFALTELGKDSGKAAIAGAGKQLNEHAVSLMESAMGGKASPLFQQYAARNAEFATIKNGLAPIEKVLDQVRRRNGDMQPVEQLYKNLFEGAPARKTIINTSWGRALEALKANLPADATVKGVDQSLRSINVNRAASAFLPRLGPGVYGAPALAAAGTAAVTGNVPAAIGAGAVATVMSPRAQLRGLQAVGGLQTAVKTGFSLLDTLGSMSAPARATLLKRPDVMERMFQTVFQSQQVEDEIRTNLLQQGAGRMTSNIE